jgi:hypothetical protein
MRAQNKKRKIYLAGHSDGLNGWGIVGSGLSEKEAREDLAKRKNQVNHPTHFYGRYIESSYEETYCPNRGWY